MPRRSVTSGLPTPDRADIASGPAQGRARPGHRPRQGVGEPRPGWRDCQPGRAEVCATSVMSAMWPGRTRQQPPTTAAPAAIQRVACALGQPRPRTLSSRPGRLTSTCVMSLIRSGQLPREWCSVAPTAGQSELTARIRKAPTTHTGYFQPSASTSQTASTAALVRRCTSTVRRGDHLSGTEPSGQSRCGLGLAALARGTRPAPSEHDVLMPGWSPGGGVGVVDRGTACDSRRPGRGRAEGGPIDAAGS
jgi:hypothetical protein